MRVAERDERVRLISGRIMRSTAYRSHSGNPAKTVRNMVEAGVRSGLMYRSREDDAALTMIDIAEADALVAEWRAALEDEEGGDREISAGVEMAEFIERLSSEATLAFGEPGKKKG